MRLKELKYNPDKMDVILIGNASAMEADILSVTDGIINIISTSRQVLLDTALLPDE